MKKQCTKCGNWHPATTKFFHKSHTQSSGLHPRCKQCRSEERKERYGINGEKEREQMRQYAAEHSTEAVERVKQWRKENPNARREFRERHLEELRAKGRQYVKDNPLKFAVNNHKRRARLANAEGSYTKKDIHKLYKKQRGKCAYCGVSIKSGYDIDHIVPLARGGSNWPDNLALACPACNRSKQDKLLSEWIR